MRRQGQSFQVPPVAPCRRAPSPNVWRSVRALTCRISRDHLVHLDPLDPLARSGPSDLWGPLAVSVPWDFRGLSGSFPPSEQPTLPGCSNRSLAPSGRFSVGLLGSIFAFPLSRLSRRFPLPRPRSSKGSFQAAQLMFPWYSDRPRTRRANEDRDFPTTARRPSSKPSTSYCDNFSRSGRRTKPPTDSAHSSRPNSTRSAQLSQRGRPQSYELNAREGG